MYNISENITHEYFALNTIDWDSLSQILYIPNTLLNEDDTICYESKYFSVVLSHNKVSCIALELKLRTNFICPNLFPLESCVCISYLFFYLC